MNKKPIDIIIVSYNAKDKLKRCINSVRKFTKEWNYLITVIDNGSRDGTKRFLRSQKDLNVIYNNSNLGFAKAINLALKKTKNELIVCLDDDTEVTENWLNGLYKEIAKKKVGIVGPQLLFPNLKFHFSAFLIIDNGININNMFRERYLRTQEVDGVSGACWLMKRELLRNVGYFDERFSPCAYEDMDYCFRVRLSGCKIIYTTQVKVIHHHLTRYTPTENYNRFSKKWPSTPTISLADDNIANKCNIKAMRYLDSGEFKKAAKELKKVAKVDMYLLPPNLLWQLGCAYFNKGHYREALIEFKKINNPYSDGSELFTIGYCLHKTDKDKEAFKIFKRLLKDYLSNHLGYYGLGLCYDKKEQYQQATFVFRKAIRTQPKFYPAYNSLGTVYFKAGKVKQSTEVFKKAIKINPVYQDAHYNLGVCYQELRKYKEAVKSYKRALKINPRDKEARDNLKAIINE